MEAWQARTGFEFMEIDEVSADHPGEFIEAWKRNVLWLAQVLNEANGLIYPYEHKMAPELQRRRRAAR